MGVKINPKDQRTFLVSYNKRHPITRESFGLRRKGIKTRAEARRVYDELVLLVNEKLKRVVVPPWEEVIKNFLHNCTIRGLTPNTIYAFEKCLNAYTLTEWKDRPVDSITTQEIKDLLNTKLGQKAPSYQHYFLKIIRGVFSMALDAEFIKRNPTPTMKFKIRDRIRPGLTEDQIKTLLRRSQELNWDWYPHYAVALYTGLRSGEMHALTWDKVDFDKRTILVDCSWGSKTGVKPTKSGDDRIVEIPNPLLPLLKELKLVYGKSSNNVLPRSERWDRGQQAHDLRIFLKSVGLPEIRFHDLRASWATLLLSKGVEPAKVMSMGGWKDMDTMMIYMRKAGISIKGSTNCLDDLQTHGVHEAKILSLSMAKT